MVGVGVTLDWVLPSLARQARETIPAAANAYYANLEAAASVAVAFFFNKSLSPVAAPPPDPTTGAVAPVHVLSVSSAAVAELPAIAIPALCQDTSAALLKCLEVPDASLWFLPLLLGKLAWRRGDWRQALLLYNVSVLVQRGLANTKEDGRSANRWLRDARRSLHRLHATRLKVLAAHWDVLTVGTTRLAAMIVRNGKMLNAVQCSAVLWRSG